MQDVDRIEITPIELTLSSGVIVIVDRLKTRQFFRLLKILTRGAGHMLMEYRLDGNLSQEEFTGRLIALIALSIPEAEDEAIDFLRSMVRPVGLIEGRDLNKQDKERNTELWAGLEKLITNPEIEDTVDIIEAIVKTEAADIQSLGKRLQKMFKIAEKTGQLKPTQTPSTNLSTQTGLSEDSVEPSI
jgi:hypothetical protein